MNPQGYPPQGYPQQPPGYPPPQGPQGYGPPQGPPPRKGMNGCLLAALIVGGLVIFIGVIGGIVVWKAAKTITQVAEQGLNAPGTPELRAAGCDAAVVMDMSKISSLFDAGAASAGTEGILISCSTTPGRATPSCDDLAKTYVKAVAAPATNILVEVQPRGAAPTCKKVYGPKGNYLHDER
jgi:hypothetical protein